MLLQHLWALMTLALLDGFIPLSSGSSKGGLGRMIELQGGSSAFPESAPSAPLPPPPSSYPGVTHEYEWVRFDATIPEVAILDTHQHTSSKRRRIRNILQTAQRREAEAIASSGSGSDAGALDTAWEAALGPLGQGLYAADTQVGARGEGCVPGTEGREWDEEGAVPDYPSGASGLEGRVGSATIGAGAAAEARRSSDYDYNYGSASNFWVRRLRKAKQSGRRVKSDFKRLIGYSHSRPFENTALNVTEIKRLGIRPVLVFINKKSGGRTGEALIARLTAQLNDIQVCDLSSHRPSEYLSLYKPLAADTECGLRLLCCGGDGTAAWVLQEARMQELEHVSFGVVPLGTGNDLSGVLVEAAHAFLRARPDLVAGGARVVTDMDEILSRPEVLTDCSEWQRKCAGQARGGGVGRSARAHTNTCDMVTPLDRWAVQLERIREHDDHALAAVRPSDSVGGGTGAHAQTARRVPHPSGSDQSVGEGWWSDRVRKGLGLETAHGTSAVPRRKVVTRQLNNYMGIGCDGAVSMAFDELRRQYPGLFFSRVMNKLWYGLVGAQTFFSFRQKDLSTCVRIAVDGVPVDIPEGTQGIIVLNINSYAGGSKLWRFGGKARPAVVGAMKDGPAGAREGGGGGGGSSAWADSSISDGLLEVVAVNNVVHLGQIKTGLSNARPLAQGSVLEVVTDCSLPMQIDGEPFIQRCSRVLVDWACSADMLLPITALHVEAHEANATKSVASADYVANHAWCANYSD